MPCRTVSMSLWKYCGKRFSPKQHRLYLQVWPPCTKVVRSRDSSWSSSWWYTDFMYNLDITLVPRSDFGDIAKHICSKHSTKVGVSSWKHEVTWYFLWWVNIYVEPFIFALFAFSDLTFWKCLHYYFDQWVRGPRVVCRWRALFELRERHDNHCGEWWVYEWKVHVHNRSLFICHRSRWIWCIRSWSCRVTHIMLLNTFTSGY